MARPRHRPRARCRRSPAAAPPVRRREAMRGDRARPVALQEDIAPAASPRSAARPASARGRACAALAAAGIRSRSSKSADARALICSTSAPCAASVRPQTGPAITRVAPAPDAPQRPVGGGGKGVGGASPIRSSRSAGRPATAWPCGCASHSAKLRMAATHSPASAAACSKAKPSHPQRAAATASRCPRSPAAAASRRGGAGNWCAAGPSGHRRSDRCRRYRPSAPAPPYRRSRR